MTHGGAATAARRLHEGLLSLGIDSRFYHASRSNDEYDPPIHRARWRRGGWMTRLAAAFRYRQHRFELRRAARQSQPGNELFTSPRARGETPWPPDPGRGREHSREVIHLHWIAKLVDHPSFFASLPDDQPVVWTLHDMNPMSGGCHFAGGCDRFKSGCGHCPQLRQQSAADISRQLFTLKQDSIARANLHIVAPSRWLLEQAQASLMFRSAASFTRIPYGISTAQYYPMDRDEARARLGIDPRKFVVCFGAMHVNNRRKGAQQLVEALSSLAAVPDAECIVFGEGELPPTSKPLPPIHSLGSIVGTLQQRALYSASDVFVLPSLEDNLPLTGLEAMACGTPVVGFASGGIPDYVHHRKTGLLAPTGDADELGTLLRMLAESPHLAAQMGQAARRLIETDYTDDREAMSYQQLYRSLTQSESIPIRAAA